MTIRHTPLGAHPSARGTRFSPFTTTAERCAVRLCAPGGRPLATHPMDPVGGGCFTVELPVGPGTLYQFELDGRALPDPYARFLPEGVHGPAMVVEPARRFRHPGVARPLAEQVIYELHVGAFSEEGTYHGVRRRLPELAALGVTTIELMPLAAFAGRRGWGYDGVALYAPFAPYGTPDDLCALVDEAHGLGLGVLLDVVYNHLGPAGNYLAAYSPLYFTSEVRNGCGDAPDFAHPAMRRYVLDNARYWLQEFQFDGLRLDAIHAIVDPSPRHLLRELVDEVAALSPRRLLIGEDDRNDPAGVTDLGLDALWADDFHHQVRVTLTGETDGYYAAYSPGAAGIAEAIRGGWLFRGQVYPPTGKPRGQDAGALPAHAFVYCLQNHDQVGNRAMGDRLSDAVPLDALCAATTLLLFLPMTPLLFMGQEWAASTPFRFFTDHEAGLGALISAGRRREFRSFRAFADPAAQARIPDPQDAETFLRSRLRWPERAEEPHAGVLALHRALLTLRRTDPVLRHAPRDHLTVQAAGDLLVVRRWQAGLSRTLLVNFAPTPVPWPEDTARSPLLLRSDDAREKGAALPPRTAAVLG